MSLTVRCACGREIPVSAGEAGCEILCSCGAPVRVPLLSQLRRDAGEETESSELAQVFREMLADDPQPKPTPRLATRVAKTLLAVFLVFVLIGVAQLFIAYGARRLSVGQVAPTEFEAIGASDDNIETDEAKIREFVRLYAESKKESLAVVEPFIAHLSGELDADQLVRAIAQPTQSLGETYTRMMEIAGSLTDGTEQRDSLVELSTLVMLRHRGFRMMIEGIEQDDPAKTDAGRRIAKEAQIDILRLSVENLPEDSEEAERLRSLLRAFQSIGEIEPTPGPPEHVVPSRDDFSHLGGPRWFHEWEQTHSAANHTGLVHAISSSSWITRT